jgi:hypothetical protein
MVDEVKVEEPVLEPAPIEEPTPPFVPVEEPAPTPAPEPVKVEMPKTAEDVLRHQYAWLVRQYGAADIVSRLLVRYAAEYGVKLGD